MRVENCKHCGKEYYPSPLAKVTMYCSNACKTAANKKRRLVEADAKNKTLDMFSYQAQELVMRERPEWTKVLLKFRSTHGLKAYADLLDFAVSRCMEVVI